jgi:hypothetical protein
MPGEVAVDDLAAVGNRSPSVLWHRLLITGDPVTDGLIVQLVDEVLVPFVAPPN